MQCSPAHVRSSKRYAPRAVPGRGREVEASICFAIPFKEIECYVVPRHVHTVSKTLPSVVVGNAATAEGQTDRIGGDALGAKHLNENEMPHHTF